MLTILLITISILLLGCLVTISMLILFYQSYFIDLEEVYMIEFDDLDDKKDKVIGYSSLIDK
jgi:hypothetical protein